MDAIVQSQLFAPLLHGDASAAALAGMFLSADAATAGYSDATRSVLALGTPIEGRSGKGEAPKAFSTFYNSVQHTWFDMFAMGAWVCAGVTVNMAVSERLRVHHAPRGATLQCMQTPPHCARPTWSPPR